MKVTSRTCGGYDLVAVSGDLDASTTPHLRVVLLDTQLCGQVRLVVDLSEVTFIDASGVGLIAAARRWAESRGAELIVICPDDHIGRIFRLTHVEQVVPVVSCLAAATGREGGPAA